MTTIELTQKLVVRAPTLEDAEAVAALYNACSMPETGVDVTTPDETRAVWQTPGMDLEADAWIVATTEGMVVGYMDLWSQGPHARFYGDGQVHPDYQGHGIGTNLLRLAEARARAKAGQMPTEAQVTIVNRAASTNAVARQLLEDNGYQLVRHFWRMAIQLLEEPPVPLWPEGITVRTARAGEDERLIHAIMQEAFLDHYDFNPVPFETWLHWKTSDLAKFDPSLWFLAMEGGEVAGVAVCDPWTSEDPHMGWIDDLGVRRPWRRKGLGLALLRHSFREFYRRGIRQVGLAVDASSLTGANRLYERAGMRVVRQYDSYEKELRPA